MPVKTRLFDKAREARLPEVSPPFSSYVGEILKAPLVAFDYALDVLDTPRNLLAGILTGEPGVVKDLVPFGETFGVDVPKVSGREVLQHYGFLEENTEGLDAGDVAGLAADVALDPITYLSGGLSAAGKLEKAAQVSGARIKAAEAFKPLFRQGRSKTGQFLPKPEALKTIKQIIAEESDELARVEGQLGFKVPDSVVPEKSLSFAGHDIFTFREVPSPDFLKGPKETVQRLFNYRPQDQVTKESLEIAKRLERATLEQTELKLAGVRQLLKDKGKTPEDVTDFVENVLVGSDPTKTQDQVIAEIDDTLQKLYGFETSWENDVLVAKPIKVSRKDKSLIEAYVPEANFDPAQRPDFIGEGGPGTRYSKSHLQNVEETIDILAERMKKIQEYRAAWDDESLSAIQDLYVHTQKDLLRNLDAGVRETVLKNPTIGYVHHMLSDQGKSLLDNNPGLHQSIIEVVDTITKKNLPGKRRSMKGTVSEINKSVKELDVVKDWAKKHKVDLSKFKYFEDNFYKATASRASTTAARFMEASYGQAVFNNYARAFDPKEANKDITSLVGFIKEMKLRRWGDVEIDPKMATRELEKKLKAAGHDVNIGIDNSIFKDAMKPFQYFKSEKEVGRFWKGYDKVHNFYKGMFTVLFPQFHTRNLTGNLWNSVALGGAKFGDHLEGASLIKKINSAQKKGISPTEVLSKSEQKTYLEAIEAGIFRNEQDYIADLRDIGTYTHATDKSGYFKKALSSGHNVAHLIESSSRMGHFMSMRKQGKTVADAAESVRKYLFNYNELTSFERSVMKRAAFFYTFTRFNTPLVIENLTNPYARAWAASVGKTDEKPEEMPQWMWESNMLFRGVDDSGRAMGLNLGLPVNDPFTTLKKPLSMLTPLIGGPLQMAAGYDFFRQKPIAEDTLAPKTIQSVAKLAGESLPEDFLNDLMGLRMDSRGAARIDPGVKAAIRFSPFGRFFNQEIDSIDDLLKVMSPFTQSYGTPETMTNRQKQIIAAAKARGILRSYEIAIGEGTQGKQAAKFLNR